MPTYLKTHRKRWGLSQDEVARLAGCQNRVSVAQYEGLRALPTLETAFALQALFGVPAHEIFPGTYLKVENEVKSRASGMLGELPEQSESKIVKLKRKLVEAVSRGKPARHVPNVCSLPSGE